MIIIKRRSLTTCITNTISCHWIITAKVCIQKSAFLLVLELQVNILKTTSNVQENLFLKAISGSICFFCSKVELFRCLLPCECFYNSSSKPVLIFVPPNLQWEKCYRTIGLQQVPPPVRCSNNGIYFAVQLNWMLEIFQNLFILLCFCEKFFFFVFMLL